MASDERGDMETVTPDRNQVWRRRYERIVLRAAFWMLYTPEERAHLRSIVCQIEADMRLPPFSPQRRPFGQDHRWNEAIYRAMAVSINHRRASVGIALAHSIQFDPKYR